MSVLSAFKSIGIIGLAFFMIAISTAHAVKPIPFSTEADLNITFENENLYDPDVPEELEGHAHITTGKSEKAQKKAGLPQLDPSWYPSQLFWLLITFSLLYAIFARSILPSLSSTLENRREHIQNDLDTAEELKEQAEDAHKRYEDLMSGAYQEARDLTHRHEDVMKQKYADFMDDFRARSAEQLTALDAELETMKVTAKQSMHDNIAELASDAAMKIAHISTDADYTKSVVHAVDKQAA